MARRATKTTALKMPEMKDFPSCRLGDKNGYVTLIQTNLENRGYDIGPKGVDGFYGERTKAAVKEFQKDIGMPVPNGSVGPKTWAALQESKVSRLPARKEEPIRMPEPVLEPVAQPQYAYDTATGKVEEIPQASMRPKIVPPPMPAPSTVRVLVEGLTKFQAEVLVKMLGGGVSARIL